MEISILEGLNPLEYEHPLDKKALDTLQKTPGLDFLVNKFYELGISQVLQLELVGNSMQVNSSSLPEIYDVLEDCCEILNLKQTPKLYIRCGEDFGINPSKFQSITLGVNNPMVVISSEYVDYFSREELMFVLGREVGRIKSQHVFYQEIASLLPLLSELVTSTVAVDFTKPITSSLRLALLQWSRWSEFTLDRAGLLACQNLSTTMNVMAKISGLPHKYFNSFNLDDFVVQVREYEGFGDTSYAKLIKVFNAFFQNQAFTIARASEILKWADSGEYQAVQQRKTQIKTVNRPMFCDNCGAKLDNTSNFCSECGKNLIT